MNLIARFKAAASAFAGVKHPTSSGYYHMLLPRTRIDYEREVGDGLGSNVFMAPLQWMVRAFLEARLGLVTDDSNGGEQFDHAHPLVTLLDKPNPFYSGASLQSGNLYSWFWDGNVYLIKNRGGAEKGPVKELWYVPPWLIEPKWEGNDFITYYEYQPGTGSIYLQPEDVVHLRYGVDPHNVRKGLSPIKSLLREIFNDDESANQVASLLSNGCIPGMIISPKDGGTASEDDLKLTKAYLKNQFGGDYKGAPLALGTPTEIKQFGYDPKTMDLSAIRNVSEERVCAVLGTCAAVVGFGTGLEQTQVGATLMELTKISWRQGVIPNQELIAGELTRNLGSDFKLKPNQRLAYNRSKVSALQDDLNKQSERLARAVGGPWMTIAQARAASGLEVDDTHDVYLIPSSVIPTKPEYLDKPRPAPVLPGLPANPAQREQLPVPDEPKATKGFIFPTKAAIRGKHAEMLRMLDSMAPGMAGEVSAFMRQQAERISGLVGNGHPWKNKDADRKELAGKIAASVKRGTLAGLSLERDFVASISKAAAISVKSAKAKRPSARIDAWVENNAMKWAGEINDTTYATIDQTLADAIDEGASVSEASKMIAEALDMERDYRTTRIAQTEMLAALNEGSLEAYRENDQVGGKGWLASMDEFTRKTHLEASKQYDDEGAIPPDADFIVGDASGPAPGQMGVPEEDCNCRCAIYPVVKEQP